LIFTQNDKSKDNNPIKLKRIDYNSNIFSNSNNFIDNKTNYTINNPNLISFNNFSENIFFTDPNYKENKDITNYEFDDKFVD
jgi:hypothetical protein